MYSFNFFSSLGLIASEIYFLLGFYILAKNIKARANKLFFFVAVTMAVWGLGEGMERASLDPKTAIFWANYIAGLGATLHGPALLHFWLEFSRDINKIRKKLPIVVLYLPALIFLAIRFFYPSLMVTGVTREYWGYSTVGTGLYHIYTLVVAAYVTVVVWLALAKASKSYGKFRQQARNIGLGILISLCIGVLTQVMRPLLRLDIPELSVISTFIFISFITYAMSKYGLLDISFRLVAENIIATMEDYVVAINRDKKIVLVNNLTLNNLGYKEDELLNKPVSILFSADILSLTYEELTKRFPLLNYEAKLISKSGETIPVSANAVILKEESDEAVGFAFVLRDMRQINELINNLQQKTHELEITKKSLEEKVTELKRVNKVIVGRELRMEELRKEVKELKNDSGTSRRKKMRLGADGGI
jgi:PAS domain S-box-containing protein